MPSLLEFAHALDFSRETFDDDRTLVGEFGLAYLRGAHRDVAMVPAARADERTSL